jgi:hypothetical protein
MTDAGIPEEEEEEEEEASRAFAGTPASIVDHSCCLTSRRSGPFSWTTSAPATALAASGSNPSRW